MLVGHVLGITADAVATASRRPVAADLAARAVALIRRRAAGEPIAHLIGEREFWSLPFRCTAATLIPRPDSETLIETALARLPDAAAPLRVLDLGTGTGCLLLTILHLYPAAAGIGVDKSPPALAVAADNARRLGLAERAGFVCGDWTDAIAGTFDLILANPPYVADADLAGLSAEVGRWEPRLALAGGADGLDAYRAILPTLGARLAADGIALFEVGFGQAPAVAAIAAAAGFQHIEVSRDLAGIGRCLALARGRADNPKKIVGIQAVPV